MTDTIRVKKRNGKLETLNVEKINKCVERACEGVSGVSASEIVLDAHLQLFDGVNTSDIDKALILTARSKIYLEPNYSVVAARLLLGTIYKEVFKDSYDKHAFLEQYKLSFVKNIKLLVKQGIFSPKLLKFDLKRLADALVPERDAFFPYHGLQNVYDRYLSRLDGKVMENPQAFYMRVAMGLSINEKDKEDKAIEFYTVYSQHLASPGTPTLFNSGTAHSQLSSCFLSSSHDSIDGIFDGLWQEARKSKHAGGLGIDATNWRASGAEVKGTNGKSSGIIPWLKIYNDMLIAVDQGGKRAGSGCAYLETWHLDIEDFIELRRNNGHEKRRTPDLNTANWIPDLFLKRVEKDEDWTLFCPSECPDLHEIYGANFEQKYIQYEQKAKAGEIKRFKVLKAKELWKKMLKMLFETSHPWICFKDPSNIQYPNNHYGVVHSSNLCLTGDTPINAIVNNKYFPKMPLKELCEKFAKFDIEVLSYSLEYNMGEFRKVTAAALTRKDAQVYRITDVETGNYIKCTGDHKIYVIDVGYVEAKDLQPTHNLLVNCCHRTTSKGLIIEKTEELVDVYDITVEGNENFFANNILVHNCTEILEATKSSTYKDGVKVEIGETAVCNLASINLNNHTNELGAIDYTLLRSSIRTVVRALDNVIDINFYPTEEASKSNSKHRPIGLGVMGFQDVLYKKNMIYDSEDSVKFCDELFEKISCWAIEASADLAQERGSYETFAGSLWSQGVLPVDAFNKRMGAEPHCSNIVDIVRNKARAGMRNANVMAIAPTASISYQHGCEQSIEPSFSMLFVYENKSGSYYIINSHFVNDMKKLGLWNPTFAAKLKDVDGDVSAMNVPDFYKQKYKCALDRDMFKLIDCNAARQKWIDQSISFNIYNGANSLKYLSDVYMYAWKKGLKTTYYLRGRPATKMEKSVSINSTEMAPKACSIDNPTCESCQ